MSESPPKLNPPAPAQGPAPELAAALGRVPSGLYILTTRSAEGHPTGMLASWVQQAGFAPPMITVALRSDRYVAAWVGEAGRFVLNQVPEGGKSLLSHFGRGFEPGVPAFAGLATRDDAQGGPVLADALAYLDCECAGAIDSGDHRIFLGRVVAGALLQTGAGPLLHVRKSGLHY